MPEILPLLESRLNPAGSAGFTVNELKVPVIVGAIGVIAVPTTNVCGPDGYESVALGGGGVDWEPPPSQATNSAGINASNHALILRTPLHIFPIPVLILHSVAHLSAKLKCFSRIHETEVMYRFVATTA